MSLEFGHLEVRLPARNTESLVIGHRIWPSSLLLCQYLSTMDLSDRTVLDLGAGTGLAGLMALKCGARHVYLQDMPGDEEIRRIQEDLMRVNGIEADKYTMLSMMWGDEPPVVETVDLIISADTFYEESQFEALISTVSWFIETNPQCKFITAYHDRDAEYDISGLLKTWGLRASLIDLEEIRVDERTVEVVKGQRPADDPEEWPEDLPRSSIFLIEIRSADDKC